MPDLISIVVMPVLDCFTKRGKFARWSFVRWRHAWLLTVDTIPPPWRAISSYATPFQTRSNSFAAITGVKPRGMAINQTWRQPTIDHHESLWL